MAARRHFLAGLVRREEIPFDEPPLRLLFDDVAGLPFVLDAEISFHRAVSSTRFDWGLVLRGVARSTATTT